MRDRTDNSGSVFLLGAAVGAIIALMLAPFSGRRMRRVTKEKGKEMYEKARTAYNDPEAVRSTVDNTKRKARSWWKNAKSDVQDTVSDAKSTVGENVERSANSIQSKADDLEEIGDELK